MTRTLLPERLYARLDSARRAPVVLVLGDEGLGKSTLIRDYLAARDVPHLRFTASPAHAAPGDLVRALAQTFGSVRPAMPPSCTIAVQKLQAGGDAAVALRWAGEHLAEVSATVVLDDLHHLLNEPRSAEFLCGLIEATVPRMRWILAARDASAFPVGRWLARRWCALPIEGDELRITPDEIATLAGDAGVELDAQSACTLYEDTQGWPLGLRVALASGRLGTALSRDEVYDGFVQSALERCTREQCDRLYETAAIGRVDAAVLGALECEADIGGLLEAWGLVHLVEESSWSFYEPCRERIMCRLETLEEARRAAIVERAVGALTRVGRWREAIDLRLRARREASTAQTLDECGFKALDHGDVRCVGAALATLGEETLARHPIAAAVKGAFAAINESFDVSEAWFGMAIARARGSERRQIVLRYGMDLVRRGRPDAVEILEAEAAREEPRANADDDAALWALLGTAYIGAQAPEKARRAAQRALQRLPAVADDTLRVRVLHQAAYVALNDGDWRAAKRLAERALARAEESFLYDLAARALSVIVNVAWLYEEDVEAARSALVRLEEAGRKAGNDSLSLYAILNAYAIEVDAGESAALERLNRHLATMQLPMTRVVSEALLPAEALRAAWDGGFAHAYDLLAPGAAKLADRLRAAYRWAEVAVYGAAAGKRSEARDAIECSRERLAKVELTQPLAIRSVAYLALAETLLGEDALAHATITDARLAAAQAPARVRALVDAVAAFHACRRRGISALLGLGAMLDELQHHALGGVARFIVRLPVETIEEEPVRHASPLGVAG